MSALHNQSGAFHLLRSSGLPDERYDTLHALARRIHDIRQRRAIKLAPGALGRVTSPHGACVAVRLEGDQHADTLVGYAFLPDLMRGTDHGVAALSVALRQLVPDLGRPLDDEADLEPPVPAPARRRA